MNTERENVKWLLAAWPIKGRVLAVKPVYDPETKGDIPMEIDEYGNCWIDGECITDPPKLPASWLRMKERLESIMQQAGFDPACLQRYEDQYCTQSPRAAWEEF